MNKRLISIPDPLSKKIEKIAKEKGVSFAEVVRRVLDRYFEEMSKGVCK